MSNGVVDLGRRWLAIQTSDSATFERGRLLKVISVLIGIGTAISLPLVALSVDLTPRILIGLIAAMVAAAATWWLSHRGYIRSGGLLLGTVISGVITLSADPVSVLITPAGSALLVAPLIGGLVASALMVLISAGLVALIQAGLLIAYYSAIPEASRIWAYVNILLLLVLSALLTVLIRSLDHLAYSRGEANAALKAQSEIAEREQSLLSANAELSSANQRMAELLDLVQELESPLIPVLPGAVVVPLVGHLDSGRIQRLQDSVLDFVYQQRPHTVLIDITGIQAVDSAFSSHLERLIQAIRLLGATVMLTGMRAEIARALVDDSINLDHVVTTATLQDGVLALWRTHT